MKKICGAFILVASICLFTPSCSEEPSIDPINELERFVGNYAIQGTHEQLKEIITLDSMGNFLNSEFGLVEEPITDTIVLSLLDENTLNVSPLISQNNTIDANLLLENDTLNIDFNQSESTDINRVTGKIWLNNDQIYLDYRWTKGTDWGEQFPLYGDINANGPKL